MKEARGEASAACEGVLMVPQLSNRTRRKRSDFSRERRGPIGEEMGSVLPSRLQAGCSGWEAGRSSGLLPEGAVGGEQVVRETVCNG